MVISMICQVRIYFSCDALSAWLCRTWKPSLLLVAPHYCFSPSVSFALKFKDPFAFSIETIELTPFFKERYIIILSYKRVLCF